TNFGDDALMKCIHEDFLSEFDKSELAYQCTQSSYLNKIVGNCDILPLSKKNINTKLLLYGGGTQFYAFEENSIQSKLSNNKNLLMNPLKLLSKIAKVIL